MSESAWSEALLFLPDEKRTVPMQDGLGPVSFAGEGTLAHSAADSMQAECEDAPSVLSVRDRLKRELSAGKNEHWRGAVAAALLLDTWDTEAKLACRTIRSECSGFAAEMLAAAGVDSMSLLVLEKDRQQRILGIADTELGLVPAAWMDDLMGFIPDRVCWYHPENNTFSDPTDLLNQLDRHRLAHRLRLLGADAQAFARDLEARDRQLTAGTEDWMLRVETAVSLSKEPLFSDAQIRRDAYTPVRYANPLLLALKLSEPAFHRTAPQETLFWRDIPIGRTNLDVGWEPSGAAGEQEALEQLQKETDFLHRQSRRYQSDLADRLTVFLPSVTDEEKKAQCQLLRDTSRHNAVLPSDTFALAWPWDQQAPSFRLVLQEALGRQLAEAIADPFSDLLLISESGNLGDPLLNNLMNVETGRLSFWTAVPPVSDKLAAYTARYGLPDGLLLSDCLRLDIRRPEVAIPKTVPAAEDPSETEAAADDSPEAPLQEPMANVGEIDAVLKLSGSRMVELIRTYRIEDQRRLRADELPEIAMWPFMPIADKRWRAYYVSFSGRYGIGLQDEGGWKTYGPSDMDPVQVVRTDSFPLCVSLMDRDRCCGTLLNQVPLFTPDHTGVMEAVIDPGSSCISMVCNRQPLDMPSLWHIMLAGSEPAFRSQPLPVWPVNSFLPSGVRLNRSEGTDPFLCGRILPAETADTIENVIAGPVWQSDADGVRARMLLLREAALLLSLHAVIHGADSISWKLVLPDALAESGRQNLLEEMRRAAQLTAQDTGLAFTGNCQGLRSTLSVGAYFKQHLHMSGTFSLLEIGGMSASSSFWLRGVNYPVAEMQIDRGINSSLIGGLMSHPEYLTEDFGELESLPLPQLRLQLSKAGVSMRSVSLSRWLSDSLVGRHLPETADAMNRRLSIRRMTHTQALLILGFAEMFTLAGLSLEQIFRDPTLNDRLPVELPLYLCGRGAWLFSAMSEPVKWQLLRFPRVAMSVNHPTRSLPVYPSQDTGMEAALGLGALETIPMEMYLPEKPPVASTAMLVHYFLIAFVQAFPAAAELLFPGITGPGGMLSPTAMMMLERICHRLPGSEAEAFCTAIDTFLMNYGEMTQTTFSTEVPQ